MILLKQDRHVKLDSRRSLKLNTKYQMLNTKPQSEETQGAKAPATGKESSLDTCRITRASRTGKNPEKRLKKALKTMDSDTRNMLK